MKLPHTKKPLSERHSQVFSWRAPKHLAKMFVRRFSLEGRISTSPAFKRNIVKPAEREAMLEKARKILGQCRVFENGTFSMVPSSAAKLYPSVIGFYYKDIPVAIKITMGHDLHGHKPAALRADFLAHQRAVRAGVISNSLYILRSPKVYVRIGDFLIMECVSNVNSDYVGTKELQEAKNQLQSNLHFLRSQDTNRPFMATPQVNHVMISGFENGKFVFYLPYDYV